MSNVLYFLKHDKFFLSVYHEKNMIIAALDKVKMNQLRLSMVSKSALVCTRANSYKGLQSLTIVSQRTRPRESHICHLDMDDLVDLDYLNHLQTRANSDIFVVYDFESTDEDIMTIRGITVSHPTFADPEYLDHLYGIS